jgi:hypothetical protein
VGRPAIPSIASSCPGPAIKGFAQLQEKLGDRGGSSHPRMVGLDRYAPNRHDTESITARSLDEVAPTRDTISHYAPVLIASLSIGIRRAGVQKKFGARVGTRRQHQGGMIRAASAKYSGDPLRERWVSGRVDEVVVISSAQPHACGVVRNVCCDVSRKTLLESSTAPPPNQAIACTS